MKNKLLIILVLLLFVGCGKTDTKKEEKVKNNPKDLSYDMIYHTKEKIDDNNTRIYAVLENTSTNSGEIAYISYGVNINDSAKTYTGGGEYNRKFNAGEQIIVSFEVPINIDEIDQAIYVMIFYSDKNPIPVVKNSKEYKQVNAIAPENTLEEKDNKSIVTIDTYFTEEAKLGKLKITTYNTNESPTCIAYVDVNKTVKKDKKYTYEFECDAGINIDGYTAFETLK